MLCGFLSPRHGASSGFEWRRCSPDMEGSCEILNKQSRTADKGVVLQLGDRAWS
jgi:hypothetical protein